MSPRADEGGAAQQDPLVFGGRMALQGREKKSWDDLPCAAGSRAALAERANFYRIRTHGHSLKSGLLDGPGLRGYGHQILSHNLVVQLPDLLHDVFKITEYRR